MTTSNSSKAKLDRREPNCLTKVAPFFKLEFSTRFLFPYKCTNSITFLSSLCNNFLSHSIVCYFKEIRRLSRISPGG